MKLINSDDNFERLLDREGMLPTPDNIYSPRGQAIRGSAKALTSLQQALAVRGRLGLVIDGTGKNLAKIKTQNAKLKSLGYETAIVFVNTDEKTALQRNRARPRQLPDQHVSQMWKGVQNNMGAFQQIFKNNMIIVDNSDNVDTDKILMQAFRDVKRFVDSPVRSHIAKKWIHDQESARKRKMNEKLDASDSMGKWIDDFQKSDAPQFKGKSKKKRRQMAVAAKLDAMDERTEVPQDKDIAKRKGSQPAKYHAGLGKSTKQKRDAQFKRQAKMSDSDPKAYKPAAGDKGAKTKPSKYTKFVQRMMDEEEFKPHMMYHPKTGKGIMAKRYGDHVRLDKLGYVHDKKDVKEKVEDVLVDPKTKKDPMALPQIGKLRNVKKRVSKQRVKDTKVFDKIKIDEQEELEEISMSDIVKSKTIYKDKYKHLAKAVLKDYEKDKKSRGGSARHGIYYYAGEILRKMGATGKMNSRILGDMAMKLTEEYKYERGTPEGTAYMKAMTPGEPGKTTKKNKTSSKRHYKVVNEEDGKMCGEGKYYCRQRKACVDIPEGYKDRGDGYIVRESVAEAIEHVNRLYAGLLEDLEDNGKPIIAEPIDTALTEKDIRDMMLQADNITIDDMLDLGMLEPDEVVEVELDDEDDYEDDIQVTEALTPLGRIKRRQAARRNKTKLKLARVRAMKRAGGNARIKMRATRGARNMMYKRLLRGRDKSALPPSEKARLETMIKRFQPLISRIAVRLVPQMRKVELGRLKKRGSMSAQKAKKFVVKKGGSASKYKAKKFKIKKAKK